MIQITEPMTMTTDYILGIVSTILGVRLVREFCIAHQKAVLLWGLAFLSTAVSAYVGGTYHGFTNYLGTMGQSLLWKATVYLIGVMSLKMLAGSIMARISNPTRRFILALIGIKFLVFAWWMTSHDDFKYVIYDYAPAMAGVLLLHLWNFSKSGRGHGDGWIMMGVLLSLGGATLQQTGFSLHQHFNHNDIYHVIQTAAMFSFYTGARLLRDS